MNHRCIEDCDARKLTINVQRNQSSAHTNWLSYHKYIVFASNTNNSSVPGRRINRAGRRLPLVSERSPGVRITELEWRRHRLRGEAIDHPTRDLCLHDRGWKEQWCSAINLNESGHKNLRQQRPHTTLDTELTDIARQCDIRNRQVRPSDSGVDEHYQ